MVDARRVTINDVALLSGLSICTVSRALRGLPNVSEKAQRTVEDAAAKLGYRASSAAARLAGGSTRSVAIVVPTATAWFFAQAVEAAEEALADAGYDTVLISLRGSAEVRQRVFGGLPELAQRVDGVLLLNVDLDEAETEALHASALAVASIGMHGVPWDNVGIDNEAAAWTATQHLLELGHWNLAILSGREVGGSTVVTATERRRGFERALAEHELTVHPDAVLYSGSSIEGGRRAMTELIEHRELPSAVFADCDETAFGALMAMRDHGLGTPKHVSVIGIDDHSMSAFFGLSTVAQPVADQGSFAANLLVERLQSEDRGAPGQSYELGTTLVRRKSTRHFR